MRIVAGEWRGRRIAAPPGQKTRPTTDRVREAWMSIVASRLPGSQALDLFAGSGALGLEALSRGVARVVFVEQSASVVRVLRSNIDALGAAERSEVIRGDALRYAAALAVEQFDVAFADPPYGSGLAERIVAMFRERPFSRLLCVEHERSTDFPDLEAADSRRYGDTCLTFFTASVGVS